MPSIWTKYNVDGEKIPKYTSGTYRLKIIVDNPEAIFGIKTSNIRMSNTIYVNGEPVGNSGDPAENVSYKPHNFPYVAYFSPGKQEIELLVHVANFDYASGGGIVGFIFFGDQQSIGKLRESSLTYDWVTIAAFLTMFVYFVGSYFHARINVDQFFFSLFCFANVLYTASHGEKAFQVIFPLITYGVFERIQMLSSILVGWSMLLYFYHALKSFASKRLVNILSITGLLLMSSSMLPVKVNSSLQNIFSLYILIVILYAIYIQFIAYHNRSVGAAYLLFSTFTILVYYIVGTLNIVSKFPITLLPPLLPFICLTMLSLYISHRLIDSYLKKEEISNALMRVDKLKDEFFAKISHEFRTPLHGIIVISQSMQERSNSPLTKEQNEKMSLIMSIAQKLSYLVNDYSGYFEIKGRTIKISYCSGRFVCHFTCSGRRLFVYGG